MQRPIAVGDLHLVREALTGHAAAKRVVGERLGCIDRFLAARSRRASSPLNRDELSDLAQDVRVEVWAHLERYEGRAALETWVYRFCHIGFIRRISRGREHESRRQHAQARYAESRDDAVKDDPKRCASPELARLLGHLTEREAVVTRRRHVEMLEFQQIADELGLSASSVKTYYYRALEKLRAILGTAGEDSA